MATTDAPNTTTLPEGALQPTTTEQAGSRKVISVIDTILNTPSLPTGTQVTPTLQTVQPTEAMATAGLTGQVVAATPTAGIVPTITPTTVPGSTAAGQQTTATPASMAAAQCASYGSGTHVANETIIRADAKQSDGSTSGHKLAWAPPASAADNTTPNLILDGRSSNIDQACGNQIIIKNGTPPSAHTDNYIYIGSKDSTGLATDGATLSLFVEGTVQNTALDSVGTLSHRICVWVNGTEYYLYLDPV